MNTRKISIILILLFSLLFRLGIAFSTKDTFFERGNRYSLINPIARNIIKLGEFSKIPGGPTADSEPLYPLFVAIAYYLMGENWFSLALLQSIINLLNGLVIYRLASTIFKDNKVSLGALLLFVIYPFYVFQSISVSDTVFFSFLLALSVYLTLFSREGKSVIGNLAVGGSWGLTLLTRFSAISLFPFALVYIFLNNRSKKSIKAAIMILIGCIAILIPWLYRNYRFTGEYFITSHGAIELWFGYNKATSNVIKNDISVDRMRALQEAEIPELKRIRQENHPNLISREAEESKIFLRHAIDYVLNNPWPSIKMMPIKFWKFWSWNYNPVPTNPDPLQDRLRRIAYTVSFLPILILSLVGIFFTRDTWRTHSIFLLIFVGYSALHTIVYGFSRLRVPIDQFLMIYAAYTLVFLLKKLNSRFINLDSKGVNHK